MENLCYCFGPQILIVVLSKVANIVQDVFEIIDSNLDNGDAYNVDVVGHIIIYSFDIIGLVRFAEGISKKVKAGKFVQLAKSVGWKIKINKIRVISVPLCLLTQQLERVDIESKSCD